MGARGVLFALDALEAERILACRGDDEVIAVVEEVEEGWDRDHLFELDKSWDALHRCFTDGDLAFENGEYPLSHVILGGRLLHEGDYIVCYVAADQVREVAVALEPLDEQWLSNRFVTLTFDSYQGVGDAEDIAYTQGFLPGLKNFYRTAAQNGRAAVFTVDQ
ncbi:YfbM family protein [Streptomyces sp. NBC_01214]|uniref:DUF1877 family protein n=1 Tax=Streptomyces sp. NBC_01214 TaxID=2903777 RepID=UPI0022517BEB|nr:DUF1877 family protein [Streptomyces sp. NBC_01214]MCX4808486.1 YfbM family protein [Streptomyces sp. NBC_01214]